MKTIMKTVTAAILVVSIAPSFAAAQRSDVSAILRDYERIRVTLADDRGAVAEPARRIASRAAAVRAPANQRSFFASIATASRRLASTNSSDMPALRRAFGQLSEPLIELLKAHAGYARGQHLFHCPMADGYGGWIQPTDEIQNPYMGHRMLMCGTTETW